MYHYMVRNSKGISHGSCNDLDYIKLRAVDSFKCEGAIEIWVMDVHSNYSARTTDGVTWE